MSTKDWQTKLLRALTEYTATKVDRFLSVADTPRHSEYPGMEVYYRGQWLATVPNDMRLPLVFMLTAFDDDNVWAIYNTILGEFSDGYTIEHKAEITYLLRDGPTGVKGETVMRVLAKEEVFTVPRCALLPGPIGMDPPRMAYTVSSTEDYVAAEGATCPVCNWMVMSAKEPRYESNKVYVLTECDKCKSTWEDLYELKGYVNLDLGDAVSPF